MTSKLKRPAAKTAAVATPTLIGTLVALGAPGWVVIVGSFVVGALPYAASKLSEHRVWPRFVAAGGVRGVARMLWSGDEGPDPR